MGNSIKKDEPCESLNSLDVEGIIEYIKSDECKNIALLTGAGVSVSAGIPDFRSKGGLYDTLKPEDLTATDEQKERMKDDPTYVMNVELFKTNPVPFFETSKELILSGLTYHPTTSHWFIKLLEDHGKLLRLYTQNIDGLDFLTGLSKEKIICVHGTTGTASCYFCEAPFPIERMRDLVSNDHYSVPCESCGKEGVKPDVVLFGENLPKKFFDTLDEDEDIIDLLIVSGTSLTVFPANSVVTKVRADCPRVIVNRERVGSELGVKYEGLSHPMRDVFIQGDCDAGFLQLIEGLGWKEELDEYVNNYEAPSA
eukprot:TRINITY_DN9692_c0_g1_i1.p1 TRINITY_DN9692_c0_g1~~TRINITY_DN9692_c0_g1_i1.p1  ORF type:complete len:311 (+),score=65.05 TRINITY_DN9692_c0_g1_i1:22-954(+)